MYVNQSLLKKAEARVKEAAEKGASALVGGALDAMTRSVKKAAGPYSGYSGHSFQQYMPISEHRELSEEELADLEKGKRRWFPRIFESYIDKPSEMMASPLKYGLLSSIPGALIGGAAGTALAPGPGTAAGALLGGGLTGLVGGLSQNAENRTVEDLVRRFPPGARRRDLYSDPIFRQDMMMDQFYNNQMYQSGPLAGVLGAAMLNKSGSARIGYGLGAKAAASKVGMAPGGSKCLPISSAGKGAGLLKIKNKLGGGPQGGPSYGNEALNNLPSNR